ncbi:MAG: rhomboid family intramembrane serine protease [Brockia lithotrophica]|nr:rhomboid family intramembrane serine protease [Brockia lithotrophica]
MEGEVQGEATFWALVEAYIQRRGFRIVAWRDALDVRGVRPSVHLVEKAGDRVTYVRLFCAASGTFPLSEVVRATARMGEMLRRRFRVPSLEAVLLYVACGARAAGAPEGRVPSPGDGEVRVALSEVRGSMDFLLGMLSPADGGFVLSVAEVPTDGAGEIRLSLCSFGASGRRGPVREVSGPVSPSSGANGARSPGLSGAGEDPRTRLAERECAFWQEVLADGLRPRLPRYASWWSGSFSSSVLAGGLRRKGRGVSSPSDGSFEARPPMLGTYLLLGTSAVTYLLLSWPELADRVQECWVRHAGIFGLVLEGLGSSFVFGGFSSLVLAAFALYVLAPPVESAFGTARLITIYVGGGLLGVRWAEALSGAEAWGGTAALYALVGGLMSFLFRRRRLLGREFLVDAGVLLGITLLLLFAFASVHPVLAFGGLLGGSLLGVALTPELGASPVRTSFWALVAYGLFLAWGMLSA